MRTRIEVTSGFMGGPRLTTSRQTCPLCVTLPRVFPRISGKHACTAKPLFYTMRNRCGKQAYIGCPVSHWTV